MEPAVPRLDLQSRALVELPWGNLFITASSLIHDKNYKNKNSSNSNTVNTTDSSSLFEREEKVSIPQMITAVATMAIVTSEMIKLIGQVFVHYMSSFELSHCEDFLVCLEASHWQAFAFNENVLLRSNLIRNGFLNTHHSSSSNSPAPKRVANLLDQEVLSVECLIHIIFSLYFQEKPAPPSSTSLAIQQESLSFSKHSQKDSENFAKRWLER
jgi:hypothetical protein